jgi:hypothetical protein
MKQLFIILTVLFLTACDAEEEYSEHEEIQAFASENTELEEVERSSQQSSIGDVYEQVLYECIDNKHAVDIYKNGAFVNGYETSCNAVTDYDNAYLDHTLSLYDDKISIIGLTRNYGRLCAIGDISIKFIGIEQDDILISGATHCLRTMFRAYLPLWSEVGVNEYRIELEYFGYDGAYFYDSITINMNWIDNDYRKGDLNGE